VALSGPMQAELKALKNFLFARMYQHPRVLASMTRAKAVITELFEAFSADPKLLPPDWAGLCGKGAAGGVVRDYIAGMTDTFALAEYSRVFRTKIEL
jgi:dGTPase